MTGDQHDVGAELLSLGVRLMAVLDPLIQAVAEVNAAGAEPGRCQQSWCPVCALAAVASGEQHPLTGLLAEHGTAILAVIRAMASPPEPASRHAESPGTRYEPIPVIVHPTDP